MLSIPIYFVAYDGSGGYLCALNPDGTLKWWTQNDLYSSTSPAIGFGDTIYVIGHGWFKAINPDGTLKCAAEIGSSCSPLIGSDGTIYLEGSVGFSVGLLALNPDGSLKWEYYIGHAVSSELAIGPDGTIYLGCNDSYFYAIQGSGQLANSPWPKFRHDSKNTGRFGGP
jgi:outer membrane protein assembly factor BamB